MTTETITREIPRRVTYQTGWGVDCLAIWSDEEDGGRVCDVEVIVGEISPATEKICGETLCVKFGENFYVPVGNFRDVPDLWEDDTHDFRCRWFATEDEARAHAERVERSWANPAPWESFIRFD